ncbi:hypothetical protein [Xylanimonas oleitrophica]|uniref:hypothetical protein n=1 Tax=Xylanimonas oleitrophica TaxID=2607479 RepID=UPI0015CFB6FE|nr:hypothetical protein [Xylanimonas oleitrophica]
MDLRKDRFVRAALIPTVIVVALASGCAPSSADASPDPSGSPALQVRELGIHSLTLPSGDPGELAVTTSQLLFDRAPVVVLATAGDESAAPALAAVATALNAPALLVHSDSDTAPAVEAKRLGAQAAVVVGEDVEELPAQDPAMTGAQEPVEDLAAAAQVVAERAGLHVVRLDPDAVLRSEPGGGAEGAAGTAGDAAAGEQAAPGVVADDAVGTLDPRRLSALREELAEAAPAVRDPELLTEVLALVDPQPGQEAALATLRAAGAVLYAVPGGDPGASAEAVQMIHDAQALTVIGVGPSFDDADRFTWQVRAAEKGQQLPTGTQRLLPARFDAVATRLGRTTQQTLAATDSLGETAPGAGAADAPVVPTLVLRASARQTAPGPDGQYLRAEAVEDLEPVVAAAQQEGRYVVLELEGGAVALDDQVRALAPLLARGGVGVLVHPEQRRSGAGVVKGGSVPVAELQATVDYLAGMVTKSALPQTLLAVSDLDSAVQDADELVARPQVAVIDADELRSRR